MIIRTGYGYVIQIPSMLYNYKVIEKTGDDIYSAIIKVQDINSLEYFRAKIYSRSSLHTKIKMINNEIRILRSINHPNISKLHEYFNIKNDQGDKLTVLIERYFMSLHEYVAVKGLKDEMIKKRIEKGILQAICYLHQNHIIHHNICPDNIYLDDDLNPKLSGFGASMNLMHKLSFYDYAYHDGYYIDVNETNFFAPTNYLYNFRSSYYIYDIWSFGILLFYITEKRLPFHTKDKVKSISKEMFKLDNHDVMKIIQKCTKQNLSRIPSAQQLLSESYFTSIN